MTTPKVWYIDTLAHSGHYGRTTTRHTAWSQKPRFTPGRFLSEAIDKKHYDELQKSISLNYVPKSTYDQVKEELDQLKLERNKVAQEKVECADCGSLLARW